MQTTSLLFLALVAVFSVQPAQPSAAYLLGDLDVDTDEAGSCFTTPVLAFLADVFVDVIDIAKETAKPLAIAPISASHVEIESIPTTPGLKRYSSLDASQMPFPETPLPAAASEESPLELDALFKTNLLVHLDIVKTILIGLADKIRPDSPAFAVFNHLLKIIPAIYADKELMAKMNKINFDRRIRKIAVLLESGFSLGQATRAFDTNAFGKPKDALERLEHFDTILELYKQVHAAGKWDKTMDTHFLKLLNVRKQLYHNFFYP